MLPPNHYLFIIYLSAVALSCGRQMAFSVSEKVCMCYTLLPAILRNKSQFHVTVCIKCKCFTSHNVNYHTNSCTLVFCFSQGDDHSLKEGKVCLQVLNAHKLWICLLNSSFRARTFLQSLGLGRQHIYPNWVSLEYIHTSVAFINIRNTVKCRV